MRHNSRQLERELLRWDTETARIRLSQLYQRQGRWEEARKVLEGSEHLLARAERTAILLHQGEHAKVIEAGKDLLSHWPGATDMLEVEAYGRMSWVLGVAMGQQGHAKSRDLLESAARTLCVLGIDLSQVRLDLALTLLKLGDFQGAIRVYRQVLDTARKNRDARTFERAMTEGCSALICAGEFDLTFLEGMSNKPLRTSLRNLMQALFQRTSFSEDMEELPKPRDVYAALAVMVRWTERAFQEFHLGHFGDARKTSERVVQTFDLVRQSRRQNDHSFEVLYGIALYMKGLCEVIVRDLDGARQSLEEMEQLNLQNPLVRCLRGVLVAELYSIRKTTCASYPVQDALEDVVAFFEQSPAASQQFLARWLLRFGIGVLVAVELVGRGTPVIREALREVMFITPIGAFLNYRMINHPSAGAISQSLYEILEVHRAQEPKHEMQIYRHRLTMRENDYPPITFSLIVDHLVRGFGVSLDETSDLMYLKRFLPEKYQKWKEALIS
ncbi:tetratricopeptide repeat protein [Deinococcus cellulosilyticus]|uniref:tetratricopeptide repeat protein n=1 Tax=Deinococcus cellulosilyticus TaxID=401558 RepID=UPI0036D43EA0